MKRRTACTFVLAGLTLLAASAAQAADPSGTWKWKFSGQQGREVELTLKLKAEGEKLTGTLDRGQRSSEITGGTFKNDEVSFEVTNERNGNKVTTKYKGKLEGDSIKGTSQSTRGEGRTRDWEAKREK